MERENRLALVIGNSEYEDSTLSQLRTPDADVEALARALEDEKIGGFDGVMRLINNSADAIRREISRFLQRKKPSDLLLLYFSGHGVLDEEGQLYLAGRDTEHDLLQATAIPASFITGQMDRSRSQRLVLVLDCCHSGAFARGAKRAGEASVGTKSAFEGNGYGRVVLTATDALQYAWEGDEILGDSETSIFTRYLIRGIETGEADLNENGFISLDELYDYVYEQVVQRTSKQTPGKWSYKQKGDIIIAHNPRRKQGVELPDILLRTLHDGHPWEREGAIIELGRILSGDNADLARRARQVLESLLDDDSRRIANAAARQLSPSDVGRDDDVQEAEDKSTATPAAPVVTPAAPIEVRRQETPADEEVQAAPAEEEVQAAPAETSAEPETQRGFIQEVTRSPGNKTIAVASSTAVWLFEVESGLLLHRLPIPAGYPLCVAWSPDGSQIAAGGSDSRIYIWDAVSGQLRLVLEGHHNAVFAVAWFADSRRLASAGQDNSIRVWQAGKLREQLVLEGHLDSVLTIALEVDGQRIATGGADQQIRIWDGKSGQCLHTIEAHEAAVNSVAWSPDQKLLLSGSDDQTMRLWDTHGRLMRVLREHTGAVQAVAWSADGRRLASGSDDNTIRIWDASTWQTLRLLTPLLFRRRDHSRQLALCWLDDNEHLITGSSDGVVRFWHVLTGTEQQSIRGFSSAD